MSRNKVMVEKLDKLGFLDELRTVFHQSTGLTISFLNSDGGEYDFYPVIERNEYCRLLQSTQFGLKKCIESDCSALEKAKETNSPCIYECHAGLTNAAIHLEYKGIEIGSIFTGQVLTQAAAEDQFKKIYRELEQTEIPYKRLKDAYCKTRVISEEKLKTGVNLLHFIAEYITSAENDFFLKKEILLKDKELLEIRNAKIELENELQKLKISVLEYDKQMQSSGAGSLVVQDKNSHCIFRAREFIKANYHKNIKLADVADSVYLSPNYFSTVFREITGISFIHYLQKIRVNAAKSMLTGTDLPIKEIVHAVGFEDYNYFNRIFRKTEGLPPAEFRKIAAARLDSP